MRYNIDRDKLKIKEYGRYIQEYILKALTIENREERQVFVEKIVTLMVQLFPAAKNTDDARYKMWIHILEIADYQLDVDIPYDIQKPEEEIKPDRIPYPKEKIRYMHYGRNVNKLVQKAILTENPDIQREFISVIAAYMKMAYRAWNKESVTDEMIREDLMRMSDGKLKVVENADLDNLTAPNKKRDASEKNKTTVSPNANNTKHQVSFPKKNFSSNNNLNNRNPNNNRNNSNNKPTGNFKKKR